MADDTFRAKSVVVTGASSGIGREVALQLAEQGARLVLAARRAERLEEAAAACRSRGGSALAVPTDVTDEGQCESMVARALGEYSRLDMLVNVAGISPSGIFGEYDLALVEKVMRVNFLGSVYCTYYALPHLKQARGRIVAVSSLSAITGLPRLSAYIASKKAMVGFFESLRTEVQPHGVSVTLIYPNFVATRAALPEDGPPPGDAMSVETCARLIVAAAERRKREVVMTAEGKLARWFKLIAPATLDRIGSRAVDRYL